MGVLCAHLGVLGLVNPPGPPVSSGRPGVVTLARSGPATATRPVTRLDETLQTNPAVPPPQAWPTADAPMRSAPASDAAAPAPTTEANSAAFAASAASPAGSGGSDDYLPRSALTVLPRVRSQVLLDYPSGAPLGRFRGKVTLFVDETGAVRRMRFETPDAEFPPVFQEEVRQRFSAATISPGEVDGRPVKAQHVIVVDFDAGVGEDESSPPQR